jgi:hypothetical protein
MTYVERRERTRALRSQLSALKVDAAALLHDPLRILNG